MKKRILSLLPLVLILAALLCTPAFALTESEVEAQVAASGKAAVTGNVLIWFLCAVAFLKVSQKIDSLLASMGVNVGHTGGLLMGEAMVAARGVSMLVKAGGGALGSIGRSVSGFSGGTSSGSSSGTSPSSSGSSGGFFKGGLIGMASRHFSNGSTGTAQASSVHTEQSQATSSTAHTASSVRTANTVRSGGTHTASSVQSGRANTADPGIIQTDSTIQSATIQSDSSAISSQEHTSTDAQTDAQTDAAVFSEAIPHYSDVEIRSGRITGTELPAGSFEGTAFGMYHADQYGTPQGPHEMVRTADGGMWYKQYAQGTRPLQGPGRLGVLQ